ncbi:hypothetical protein BTVI_49507 [Pitangus sulphuratus]|nr:hypothetical protein BTVI_49507 [Pitangus sulphuratus]
MVRQTVHLWPMKVCGGAEIHLQPVENPTAGDCDLVNITSMHKYPGLDPKRQYLILQEGWIEAGIDIATVIGRL